MESWARIQGTPMQPTLCILLGTSLALHVIGSCRRTTRQSCTDEGSSGPAATEDLALTRIAKTLRILKLSRLLKVVRAFRYYSAATSMLPSHGFRSPCSHCPHDSGVGPTHASRES
jgi:hypothetical protein